MAETAGLLLRPDPPRLIEERLLGMAGRSSRAQPSPKAKGFVKSGDGMEMETGDPPCSPFNPPRVWGGRGLGREDKSQENPSHPR